MNSEIKNKNKISGKITEEYKENSIYELIFKLENNINLYNNKTIKLNNIFVESNNIPIPKTPLFHKKSRRDKIYDNDYNYGTLDLKFDEELRVDASYEDKYMKNVRQVESSNINSMILEDCYTVLDSMKVDYKTKSNITKKDWVSNFLKLTRKLNNKVYPKYHLLIAYCDILNIKYKILWNVLPSELQYEILSELEEVVDDINLFNDNYRIF